MARKKSSVVEQVVGPWRNRITGYGEEDPRQLLANDRNWRIHTHDQEKSLSAVLNKVGIVQSILVNKRSGKVVDGHLRAAMAISEGQSRVPVVYVDLSDEEEALILATFDRITAMAGVDNEKLEELVAEAAENFPDLAEILNGIDEYIDRGGPETTKPGLTEDDAVPEPQAEVVTTLGDCWRLGAHRLICGDSTDVGCVERLMGGEKAGLMNTDPPYGVSYANDERPNPGVAKPRVAKPRVAKDDLRDEKLQEFLERAFQAAKVALLPNAAWYLWHANLTQGYFAAAAAAAHVILHRQIIWVKPVLLLGRGQYHWKHEPCFMGWVEGNQPPDYGRGNGERDQTTVWEIDSVTQAERKEFNHSTPKPAELFRIPIAKHLQHGEVCYEPFAGSGPQFVAAESLGCRCFGIEIDPAFCDVIVRRWQNFTGKSATLNGTGRTFDEVATERSAVAA